MRNSLIFTSIEAFFCGYQYLTDKTLQNLLKIQNLSKVITKSKKTAVSGICDLIKKGPNIKTLYVNINFITKKTIEAFTERANNNQKIQYKFSRYYKFAFRALKPLYNSNGIYCNLLVSDTRLKYISLISRITITCILIFLIF